MYPKVNNLRNLNFVIYLKDNVLLRSKQNKT